MSLLSSSKYLSKNNVHRIFIKKNLPVLNPLLAGYGHKQAADDNPGISLSAIGRWMRAEQGPITSSVTKNSVLNTPLNYISCCPCSGILYVVV